MVKIVWAVKSKAKVRIPVLSDLVNKGIKTHMEYEVLWKCGMKYVGQTEWAVEIRLKEHLHARLYHTEKSAVAEHAWCLGDHRIRWVTKILDVATNTNISLLKEALYICFRKLEELMNGDRDSGVDSWLPLLKTSVTSDCCRHGNSNRPS